MMKLKRWLFSNPIQTDFRAGIKGPALKIPIIGLLKYKK